MEVWLIQHTAKYSYLQNRDDDGEKDVKVERAKECLKKI